MGVRVQIYTAQTGDEAVALARRGVDHVGVTPSDLGLPGEVDLEAARAIRDALVGLSRSVALSVATELDPIVGMVEAVRPDIVHLCGPPGGVGPDEVLALKREIGEAEIMQAVAVTGRDAIHEAKSFEAVADYLILDSIAPAIPGVGAAGTTHDWEISAEIVAQMDVPVILAGGLSPENVRDAIRRVRPWGVDSLTHTNQSLASGGFRKDLDLVEAFVAAAHGSGSA